MILFIHSLIGEHMDNLRNELQEDIIIRNDFTEVDDQMKQAEIIVGFGPELHRLTPNTLEHLTNLKWIHADTAGVETLPFETLMEKNIMLTNTRGIHGPQLSEQIMGMMMMFTRGLLHNVKNQLECRWDKSYPLDHLFGKTLCIVGAGIIGRELARKAKAFDMKVIGVKREVEPIEHFDEIVKVENMREVLKESDFIAVLTPLTPETYHLISENEFESMKPSAIFLNFSRGDVVNESALIKALQTKRIRGAGLDVFHQEPLSKRSPLWKMDNVIISPHNGGFSSGQDIRKLNVFKELYASYKESLPMPLLVDLEKRY